MNSKIIRALIISALSYTPFLNIIAYRRSALKDPEQYGLAIWLKNLTHAQKAKPERSFSDIIELGPGSTLGAGLWARLLGCDSYTAIDAFTLTDSERNRKLLNNIEQKTPRGVFNDTFKRFNLDPEKIAHMVDERMPHVRADLESLYDGNQSKTLSYVTPEQAASSIPDSSVDLVFSHAVLEHVENIQFVLDETYRMLRPGGCSSHSVDLSSHNTHSEWNGHWTYSDTLWKVICGNRSYLINRNPVSQYEKALLKSGFEIEIFQKGTRENRIDRHNLIPRFKNLSETDLTTANLLFTATKQ
ncbi:MAG: class I SAM-dependent methyltransferase [Pseudodesulfovibrio sp.]|nr:class I SAM-dependent methyltransferase [Pseudodesulfovibrio sp.]